MMIVPEAANTGGVGLADDRDDLAARHQAEIPLHRSALGALPLDTPLCEGLESAV